MYLDFKKISQEIPFKDVLDWLNIPYREKTKEIKLIYDSQLFIVNKNTNSFFCPENMEINGSVINFYSYIKPCNLRSSAEELTRQFLDKSLPKRELPELTLEYHHYLKDYGITEETALKYEVGFTRQNGIMQGRIAFKVYDENGDKIGYVGYKPEKNDWLFPKNFKRPLYNHYLYKEVGSIILTENPFDAIYLCQLNFPTVCLLGQGLTAKQEEGLKGYQSILALNREPENIVCRMSKHLFIKTAQIEVRGKQTEDIAKLF